MDDTIDTTKTTEELLLAMLEANAFAGLHHLDDVSELANVKEPTLLMYRIPREVAEGGSLAGNAVCDNILGLAEVARGGVMLSFDGWTTDPRELSQIPCVINFLRGFLLGPPSAPDRSRARAVIEWMFDEDSIGADEHGDIVDPSVYDTMTGRLWIVAHAFPDGILELDHTTRTYQRDILRNRATLEWLTREDDGS